MGTYGGPPIPGRGFPRPGPQGGVYGQPSDLVSSRTPVANKLVEGINSFIGGFQGVQDQEKQAARQEFFEGIMMMQLGFKVDMKKIARAGRKGGLPLDFAGDTFGQPQQQGAPMPGGGGGAPPMGGGGAPPMGGMPMGGMPQGGGAPVPGGGGGKGFFGRLGQALTQPVRAAAERNAPIPGNAGVYQSLGQLQQMGQQNMEKAQILQTLLKAPTDSEEFLQAAIRGEVLDISKGLPEFMQDDVKLQRMADLIPGMTVEKLRERAASVEMIKLMGPHLDKVAPENRAAYMQSIMRGELPDAKLFASGSEPLIDRKQAFALVNREYPGIPKSVVATGATLLANSDFDGFDAIAGLFPKSVSELEQEYAASREQRAKEESERSQKSSDRAAASFAQSQEKFADWQNRAALEIKASKIWAAGHQNLKQALEIVDSDWVPREERLELRDIIKRKSRGGSALIQLPMGESE